MLLFIIFKVYFKGFEKHEEQVIFVASAKMPKTLANSFHGLLEINKSVLLCLIFLIFFNMSV